MAEDTKIGWCDATKCTCSGGSNNGNACEFRRVPAYQAYDVSRCGIVRSYWKAGGHGKPRYIGTEPTIKEGSVHAGAIRHSLTDEKHRRRTISCGSIVLQAFVGLKRGYAVGYLDGNGFNCHLSNLVWITQKVLAVSFVSKRTVAEVLSQHAKGFLWCGHCNEWKLRELFPPVSIFRCRQCHNDVKRKDAYGVDQAFLEKAKNGQCEVCDADSSQMRLVIDHCHSTGAVRGVLCNNCNTAIGMFRDSLTIVANAAAYLEKHK